MADKVLDMVNGRCIAIDVQIRTAMHIFCVIGKVTCDPRLAHGSIAQDENIGAVDQGGGCGGADEFALAIWTAVRLSAPAVTIGAHPMPGKP